MTHILAHVPNYKYTANRPARQEGPQHGPSGTAFSVPWHAPFSVHFLKNSRDSGRAVLLQDNLHEKKSGHP